MTPGQGKVAGTQVSKEPDVYLFHKEANPVEVFTFFLFKIKQNILTNFLSVGNCRSEAGPTHSTHEMSQLLAKYMHGRSATSALVKMSVDL